VALERTAAGRRLPGVNVMMAASNKDDAAVAGVAMRKQQRWRLDSAQRQEDNGTRCSPRLKEHTARLGSGWRLQAVLLALQVPVTVDEQGEWRLRLLQHWRMVTCTEGRRREVSGELGPAMARGRATAGMESSWPVTR
jgi:hypothetical protein